MIYHILVLLFDLAIRQYFRKVSVLFTEPIPSDRPILFVANHQSSFMDAILIGTQLEQQLHFISRGESFNTPLKRWIWSFFNMHPIYRKEFSPNLSHKNEALIKGFQNLLLSGKSVLIFPEGISKTEPRLRKIKTGAARIALGAYDAVAGEEQAPLIIPIGLNYSNPHQFRSTVMIHFGAAIELDEYQVKYVANPWKAIRELTEQISRSLEDLTLCIPDEQLEEVVDTATTVFEEELLHEEIEGVASAKKVFKTRKEMIKAAHYFKEDFPFRLQHIKADLKHYKDLLSNYEIEDNWLREDNNPYEKGLFIFYLLRLLFLFPVFLFGYLNHIPALLLSKVVAAKTSKRPDFKGSLLLSFGLLFCLVSYAGQMVIVGCCSGSILLSIGYAFLLPLSGMLSLRYADWYHKFRVHYKKQSFSEGEDNQIQYLKAQRKQLIELLHIARVDYLKMRRGAISLL